MMAWHRLTGELQRLISTPERSQQLNALRAWWDQGDRMIRRAAQLDNHPMQAGETFPPTPQGFGEADILGAHRPGAEPAFASGIPSGDSHGDAVPVKKDASELPHDEEETRELKIADAILRAAQGMAKSPAVEEIINQATELKRIHGVQ